MKHKLLSNITPGEILAEDFLKPMGLSQYRLAKDISVPARRINEIVKGERAITADTALRTILAESAITLRFGNDGRPSGPAPCA